MLQYTLSTTHFTNTDWQSTREKMSKQFSNTYFNDKLNMTYSLLTLFLINIIAPTLSWNKTLCQARFRLALQRWRGFFALAWLHLWTAFSLGVCLWATDRNRQCQRKLTPHEDSMWTPQVTMWLSLTYAVLLCHFCCFENDIIINLLQQIYQNATLLFLTSSYFPASPLLTNKI